MILGVAVEIATPNAMNCMHVHPVMSTSPIRRGVQSDSPSRTI